MNELTYLIGGETVSADELARRAKRAPKPVRASKENAAAFHKGWVVEGHPPGAIAAAKELAMRQIADWREMGDEERAAAIKDGRRPPKAWSEDAYVAETKKKRPVSRHYAILSAADACADLARKAGWEYVQVTALQKGRENAT